MIDISSLKFDDKGLIPAIVQDASTKKVLTLAYMNRESLQISIDEKRTCFYSRSRQELWRKGETSGNYQNIVSITSDCDGDSIVVLVDKLGPACHTGADSCFGNLLFGSENIGDFSLESLYELLESRNKERPEGSYTTYLFEKGREKILKKVGEECSEVIIGAMKNSREETVYEIADLCYHTMVLMVEMGIDIETVKSELASRHIVDKKTKQETLK